MVTAITIVAIIGITGIAIAVPIAVNAANKLSALIGSIAAHAAATQVSGVAPRPHDLRLYEASGVVTPPPTSDR